MTARPERGWGRTLAAAFLLLAVGAVGGWLLARTPDRPGLPEPDGRAPTPTLRAPTLEVGLVANDSAVLAPPASDATNGFDAARRAVDAIAPRRIRIDVRWDLLQPRADRPLDPTVATGDGCGRDQAPPCAGPQRLSDQLTAVAAAQRRHPGRFRPLITFWGMPDWAGAPGDGCRAAQARAGARPLGPGQEPAYRAAVRAVWNELTAAGIGASDWTPWNEPNAPYFLDPQRSTCAPDAPPASPAAYGRLVVAMDAELRALRGRGDAARAAHRLVVGELAAWAAPSERAVPNDEFLRALPDDVLCRADVVSLHGYLEAHPRAGRGEPVAAGLAAFDRRACLSGRPAWITETGVGAPRAGARRDTAPATLRAECRLMDRQLDRWYHHPRVTAAFQYAVRDDAAFPTGLLNEPLTQVYPVFETWAAWGGSRDPSAPPPSSPAACREPTEPDDERAPPG